MFCVLLRLGLLETKASIPHTVIFCKQLSAAYRNEISSMNINATNTEGDDPWEMVGARDDGFLVSHESEAAVHPRCCSLVTLKRLIYCSIALDLLMGTVGGVVLVMGRGVLPAADKNDTFFVMYLILAVLLSALVVLRAVATCVSGFMLDVWDRGGLLWSSYISIVLAVVEGVVSAVLIAGLGHSSALVEQWCQRHPEMIPPIVAKHVHVLWILSMACAVMECLRCILLRRFRTFLLRQDRNELLHVSHELLLADPATAAQQMNDHRRPWWWRHPSSHLMNDTSNTTDDDDDDGQGPLLLGTGSGPEWAMANDTYTPGRRTPPPRRFFAALRRSGSTNSNENLRQRGGSVIGFESVEQEWADRDKHDPQWWSHESATAGQRTRGQVCRETSRTALMQTKGAEATGVTED